MQRDDQKLEHHMAQHGKGDGGKRFQTLQDTCGLQIHCQSHSCYQSVAEEEILQRQQAQASWAVAQGDTCKMSTKTVWD